MNEDKRKIFISLFIPGLLVLAIWVVKLTEVVFQLDLEGFGLKPLSWQGLIGILTSPFIHADFSHLMANTLPLFFLAALLFYFYNQLAWTILILVWVLTGSWVWLFARGDSIHVGASGVVYGLAAFLFFSGILRRENRLMSVTLLIAFLYGGLVWGIFPQLFPNKPISWESHLMGLLSGTILAFWFRKSGPQRKQYSWEMNEDEEEDEDEVEGKQEDEKNNDPQKKNNQSDDQSGKGPEPPGYYHSTST